VRPLRYASVERLREAWSQSKDAGPRGRSAGIDHITPIRFRERLDENLRNTRERLIRLDFKFHPLRPTFIPKAGGKFRIICIPTVEDRLIQRLILRCLNDGDKLKVDTPVSYGFKRGSGIQAAVKKARNLRRRHQWVLKSDVTSFFDTIKRDSLREEVQRRLRRSSLASIVCSAIDAEIECADRHDQQRIAEARIIRGKGLRQGMPLAAVI
jgi:retron-type reverse transcriptase